MVSHLAASTHKWGPTLHPSVTCASRAAPASLHRKSALHQRPVVPCRQAAFMPSARPVLSIKTRAAAEAAAEVLYEATGVPLVDTLMSFKTMDAALQHGVQLVAIAAAGVVVGSLVLHLLDKQGISAPGKKFNLVAAAVASVAKPSKKMLPILGLVYAVKVVSALAQVAAAKLKDNFATVCCGRQAEVLSALQFFTQLVQDTSELVLIVIAAWAAIDFKDRVLDWVATAFTSDSDPSNDGIVHLLRPLGGVLSFVILLVAGGTALSAYGINIAPLMASVGGIGVVLGLASQSLMGNVAAAITLYTSRPFIVGDRIQLLAAGALVVEGKVVQIEPMRTIIRTDAGNPVYVNNAEVTGYMVVNLSQGAGSGSLDAPVAA